MACKRSFEESCPQLMDSNAVTVPPSSTSSKHDLDKDNVNCHSRVDKVRSGKIIKLCTNKSANRSGKNNNTASCLQEQCSSSMGRSRKVPWTYYFQQNSRGDTLFHMGIMTSKTKLVLSLIQAVSNPSYLNIQNNSLETPLHIAASMKQEDVLKSLICAGADISLLDEEGQSAMHIAVALGHLAGVKALMTPLLQSFSLKKRLADLHNKEGHTCLHVATYLEHIEIFTYLVQSVGANINAKNIKNGDTCLHLASAIGNEEYVLALLNLGADPAVKNKHGFTPYAVAKQFGRFTCQRLLARFQVAENNMDLDDVGYLSDYEKI